ncbi:hypothetical protein JCM10213_007904 [Rhodosporidiobolus nylandii]
MSTAPEQTTDGSPEATGLVARSTAAVSTAWTVSKFVPTVARTAASYYVYGPPQSTWPLRLTLFTAVARYQSQAAALERQISGKEVDVVKATQATRQRVEAMLTKDEPEQPKGGAVWETEFEVKKRGLKGVLAEVDAEETGSRKVKAEWTAHRSFLAGSTPSSSDRVLLYTHGGAYTLLSPKTHRPLVVQLAKELNCRALSVDYRLSPETRFPGGLLDAVNAYFYLTEDLGIPASNIIVGGDSAGGNLAVALMMYLRDEGLPQVGGAVLLSPWVDMTASLGSWDENKDYDYLSAPIRGDVLSPPRLFLGHDEHDSLVHTAYVSPALSASLASLPPLLIHSGGVEVLRDEHTLFAQRAAKEGVDVTLEVFMDGVHVFQAMQRDTGAKASLKAIREWAEARPTMASETAEDGVFAQVDEKLKQAWEAKPEEQKKEPDATAPAPVWIYERRFERQPPIQLRADAHEEARKAVEEVKDYVPDEKLTALYYPKSATQGVFARVRGMLHL